MSRTEMAFSNGKAFIPFITAGDPDIGTTEKLVLAMAESGADMVEIGVPFSDPMAEGPVIQKADERALRFGISSDDVFELALRLRRRIDIPLAIMTYANVVYSRGIREYAASMKGAGFDALILPDVPFEEKQEFSVPAESEGIDLISLIAPTSRDRIRKISRDAKGFVYVVSSLGVTGMRDSIESDIGAMVGMVKAEKDIPAAVGFGISRPEQACEMARKSDGVIVGSAIVKLCEEYGRDSVPYVAEYTRRMKAAVMRAGE